jgi:creatinine amidohydrolase
MKPWILTDNNLAFVRRQRFEVAVLPLGATEPHNLHLPYGTDIFEVSIVGDKICQAAHQAGGKVVLLPTIPYGTETNLREFPLAININPSTLNQVIRDIVHSLVASGIRKIVLLNGHGGNELKPLLREMSGATQAHLFLCNWYQAVADRYFEIFEKAEDHAGEMETSFALAFFPEFVARNSDGSLAADQGATNQTRLEAVNQGWVSISRPWHLLTSNSGSADPHRATPQKGQAMMDLLVQRLGQFLVDLSRLEIDERFPY